MWIMQHCRVTLEMGMEPGRCSVTTAAPILLPKYNKLVVVLVLNNFTSPECCLLTDSICWRQSLLDQKWNFHVKKHSCGYFWIQAILEIAREINLLLNFSGVNRFLCTNVLLTVKARDMS